MLPVVRVRKRRAVPGGAVLLDDLEAVVSVQTRARLSLERPHVMGILNVTPDSFWDGGRHAGIDAALRHAERLVEEGADSVDIGGESTRPGARPVDPSAERARVVPVVEAVGREHPELPLSVDTVKGEVARAALGAGAWVINDVSGLRLDMDVGRACAEAGAGLVLMHSRGGVAEMARYETALYGEDPVADVVRELTDAAARAGSVGVDPDAVVIDPGLGFSKRTAETVAVLRELERVVGIGRPVLLGPSRKRFVGELAGGLPPESRLPGTVAACVAGWLKGARLFRVHDVAAVRDALAVAAAVAPAPLSGGTPGMGTA